MKKHRFVPVVLAVVGSLMATVPLSGCGASLRRTSNSTATRKIGKIELNVTWPERKATRLIPAAADTIQFTLRRDFGAGYVNVALPGSPNPVTISRPTGTLTSTLSFGNLEVGPDAAPARYQVFVEAFSSSSTTPLAAGAGHANLSLSNPVPSTPNNRLGITLQSTIVNLVVTPISGTTLRRGKTRVFTATALDGNGNIVLTTPGLIGWTSSAPAVASLSATTGQSVTVTGGDPGTSNIVATETESGFSNIANPAVVNVADVGIATNTWSKFRGNAQNTGQVDSLTQAVATTGTGLWAFGTSDDIGLSSPAISAPDSVTGDYTVYVGSYDHFVYAIDGLFGFQYWGTDVGGEVESSPALSRDGLVYVGSGDGAVYALDAEDGSVVWRRQLSGVIVGSPSIGADGGIFVAEAEPGTRFYKLHPHTGAIQWQVDLGAPSVSCPGFSTDGSRAYITTRDSKVHARLASSGAAVAGWPVTAGGEFFNVAPAIDQANIVYVGAGDGSVYAYNPDGSLRWKSAVLGAPIFASVAIASNAGGTTTSVYAVTYDIVSGTNSSRLVALNPTDGSLSWQFPAAANPGLGPITASPAIGGNGAVYVGTWDGSLYGVSPTGSQLWELDTLGIIESSPSIARDGTIFVGNHSGQLFAVR